MAHKVTFSVPERGLGREDIEFVVKKDGARFGTCWCERRGGMARQQQGLSPSPELGSLRPTEARVSRKV